MRDEKHRRGRAGTPVTSGVAYNCSGTQFLGWARALGVVASSVARKRFGTPHFAPRAPQLDLHSRDELEISRFYRARARARERKLRRFRDGSFPGAGSIFLHRFHSHWSSLAA